MRKHSFLLVIGKVLELLIFGDRARFQQFVAHCARFMQHNIVFVRSNHGHDRLGTVIDQAGSHEKSAEYAESDHDGHGDQREAEVDGSERGFRGFRIHCITFNL